MKRTAFILSLCLCAFSLQAQNLGQIHYDDVRIHRLGDSVEVSFSVTAGVKSVARGEELILTPVVFNEGRKVSLPQIAVQSRRAQLQEFRAGGHPTAMVRLMLDGKPLHYSAVIPYDTTLVNLLLRIEGHQVQCGRDLSVAQVMLTQSPALVPETKALPVAALGVLSEYAFSFPIVSVAEAMSKDYPFVASLEDFERSKHLPDNQLFDTDMALNMGGSDPNSRQSEIDLFLATNEKGALQIDFERNSARIYRYYKENNTSLVTLASVLKKIERSEDSRVVKIIVAGFVSPEGPWATNDRLGWGRTEAVRNFIQANSGVPAGNILLYNSSEDWEGLRKMILASGIEHKEKLLDIIDRVPVLAGREKQLMDLGGGTPYRYMAQHFFPKLRNAAYIKVYYETTPAVTTATQDIRRAWEQMNGGNYTEALEILTALPEIPGGGVENLMGVCCMMTGQRAKADEYFRKAATNGNADAQQNLGQPDAAARE